MFELHYSTYNTVNDILCEVEFVKSRKNNKVVDYANISASFDIETSSFYDNNNNKKACMYIYVLGINGKTKIGRTWDEFLDDLDIIKKYYNLGSRRRFIIYVHNLQYEFQFIRKMFTWDEVFSLEERRPIYARTVDGIEFRCSYLLSNMSLAKVGENLTKYKVKKLVGDLDYSLIRHSKTIINKDELQYVINDGLVVMAYIQELIEEYGNIVKLPITNTGFVRELCRKNCIVGDGKEQKEYRGLIHHLKMTPLEYTMLKQAYAGGFTHANVFNVNKRCYNVSSFDFTSSYPTVMVAEQFPMSEGAEIVIENKTQFENALKRFCCLFEIEFHNLDSKFLSDNYISLSKCIKCEDYQLNNGRIVSAKVLRIVITEIDYKIIRETYSWTDSVISHFIIYDKDHLPKQLIKTVLTLYKNKTELKGIEGKEVEYARAKGQLNSCYGMCVTDPCKDETSYDGNWSHKPVDLIEAMNRYNNSRTRFLYYPWGVWITAYARYNLWTAIFNMKNDYIYSDTDSVKIMNKDKYKDYFTNYNNFVTEKLEYTLRKYDLDESYIRPKNKKGEVKPLGLWDYEGTYNSFKTLGAKRYVYDVDGKINITISGVNKKNGSEYLMWKYKNIDEIYEHFDDDLTFPGIYFDNNVKMFGNGKMTHTYIDMETEGKVIDYMGNKNSYHELSSIHMEECDYSISISQLFINYILGIKEGFII